MWKRMVSAVTAVVLLMALVTLASWFLASLDKRPKDHTRMVRLEAL